MAKQLARAQEKIARRPDFHPVDWRKESSIVTAVKRAYEDANGVQQAQLRGWMKGLVEMADNKRKKGKVNVRDNDCRKEDGQEDGQRSVSGDC